MKHGTVRLDKIKSNLHIRVLETFNDEIMVAPYEYQFMFYYNGNKFLDGFKETSLCELSFTRIESIVNNFIKAQLKKTQKKAMLWEKFEEGL